MPVTGDMHGALVVSRMLLAAVFVVAAAAKLVQVDAPSASVLGRRVPLPLARGAVALLALGELGLAAAILSHSRAREGVLAAFIALVAFVGVQARNMTSASGTVGWTNGCACFGALSRDAPPIVALFRTVGLAALALVVFVLLRGEAGPGVVPWLQSLAWAPRAFVLAGVALAVSVIAMPDLWRRAIKLASLRPVRRMSHMTPLAAPRVIIFLQRASPQCAELVAMVSDWCAQRVVAPQLETVDVETPQGRALAERYVVRGVPSVAFVGGSHIAGRVALGRRAIEKLLQTTERNGYAAIPVSAPVYFEQGELVMSARAQPGCVPCGK
ncbi:MAG: MauE/DoxX family redox-associated membrane protein [Gemmatimonadaceae bacterium]